MKHVSQADLSSAFGVTELPCNMVAKYAYSSEDGVYVDVETLREFHIQSQQEPHALEGCADWWADEIIDAWYA